MASTSNVTNPGDSARPDALSNDPTSEPKPSSRQDLPPNNDASIKKFEQTINPTKGGAGSASAGTASIGREGDVGTDKSMGEKLKDKFT